VLVSAFVFGGIPEKAIKKAFAGADIYVSPALLREYREVPLVLERRYQSVEILRTTYSLNAALNRKQTF